MLMKRPPIARHFRSDQRGFTLIETLVAMLSAVVVVGALYAILDISVAQTAKITDSVQATQIGRVTLYKISEELESACISPSFKPIQVKSTENKLIFVNAYGSKPTIGLAEAFKHEIAWEEITHRLVEKTYPSSSGSWPNFNFSSEYKTHILGEHIYKTEVEEKTEKKIIPIFQYYEYVEKSNSVTSEGALSTLGPNPLKGGKEANGLSSSEAAGAAAVEINFEQAPADNYAKGTRTVDLKNQVTLSFSVPNAESPIPAKPCE